VSKICDASVNVISGNATENGYPLSSKNVPFHRANNAGKKEDIRLDGHDEVSSTNNLAIS
jgi:hypothetical protein